MVIFSCGVQNPTKVTQKYLPIVFFHLHNINQLNKIAERINKKNLQILSKEVQLGQSVWVSTTETLMENKSSEISLKI